ASRFRWYDRLARYAPDAPLPGRHRRLCHARPRVQGQADGRSHGQRPHDRSEPDRSLRRRGEGTHPGQGCGPRSQRRSGARPHRREGGQVVMPQIEIKNPEVKATGSVELPDSVFDQPVSIPLIHQGVTAQLAAGRHGTHYTKTRGEVRGGGRKPYRQKGTGRARQGSIRAPQYTGGGIVHGPKPRDYSQRTPKKMRPPPCAVPSATGRAMAVSTSSANS